MNYTNFSKTYTIRKLKEEDISVIYDLCIDNKIYYKYCPPSPSFDSIKKDMYALPPKKDYADKYYLGYFKDDELIAILDLIDKCPKADSIFIGFFMINKKYQNQGIGTSIILELIEYIKELGYSNIRLGCVEGNMQSYSFWKKMGFEDTNLRNYNDEYTVIILNKNIK